jgi:hypothetical protein
MLFLWIFIFFLLPSNALRCTTNCSYTYNITKSFDIPDRCNQIVSAGKCTASVKFWYERGEYIVSFHADSSSSISIVDNVRHVMFQLPPSTSPFFAYSIDHACKDKDDCARELATNSANEMLKQEYNFSTIINEVIPLVSGPPLSSNNTDLVCFISQNSVRQCAIANKRGSCVISHQIQKNELTHSCQNELITGVSQVTMYQSDNNYATFDIRCNRNFCNGHLTLDAVKQIMFKYNVTKTPDGRLNHGSRSIISIKIILISILMLFF